MHPGHPNSTICCSTLLMACPSNKLCALNGAVGHTYLPPGQPKLVSNIVDPPCPGEEGNGPSLQGCASESCSFGDPVQHTPEPSRVVYGPSVAYTRSNTAQTVESVLAGARDTWVLQNAAQEVGETSNYANCPTTQCLYPAVEGNLCLQEISCAAVPSHFTGHGIENKSRKQMIRCEWEGCVKKITRHIFARHIREVHLRHLRGTNTHSSGVDSRRQT
ncbi:hypothetical protein EDD16DRAFT_328763 [Pisolithus croceorrhizus]|nr:hypothetical protein EDD16DRAFT_328763 [Pisolithus croceorrhizus]KAI6129075.1 hypothetical protein EV401DRAFT_808308 [Pisolithus croceorrhizus]